MLAVELDADAGIAIIRPQGKLGKQDFEQVAAAIDPVIQAQGKLNGLIICTESFPGWDSFGAMLEHFKFVNEHHKVLAKVALVTDSLVAEAIEPLASHFALAEISTFGFDEMAAAREWVLETD
jgi:hypothetical protein